MPAIVGPIHIDRVYGNGAAHFGGVFPISPKSVDYSVKLVQVPIMQGTSSNFLTVQTSHLFGI